MALAEAIRCNITYTQFPDLILNTLNGFISLVQTKYLLLFLCFYPCPTSPHRKMEFLRVRLCIYVCRHSELMYSLEKRQRRWEHMEIHRRKEIDFKVCQNKQNLYWGMATYCAICCLFIVGGELVMITTAQAKYKP